MTAGTLVSWLLEQEARALLTRLEDIKPFAIHETMVPAANLSPAAQLGIERTVADGRTALRRRVLGYLSWLRGPGRAASPADQQRRFVVLRLQFNNVLTQFDLFTEVVTQRSEHGTGVWLSGLDALATDALRLPGDYFEPPPVACYLARGPGAAIRRARTRLPGGASNPIAIVRVPRERMVGHGIASSLIHEVGHQAAALLSLVPSLRSRLQAVQRSRSPADRAPWACFEKWISEIAADYWSVGMLGIGSTLGLIGVVSLPALFVYRPSGEDPHPVPWLRVLISCGIGDALYPHPQWAALARVWTSMYPPHRLAPGYARTLAGINATIPDFVRVLVNHHPPALRGRSLRDVMPIRDRRPERLLELFANWRHSPAAMVQAPPSLVFAAVGQARAAGQVSPEWESRALGGLLTAWAVRSSLDVTELCAIRTTPAAVPAA
jgi:hypothetical protein